MDSNNWFWISLNILGGAAIELFLFEHSLASYRSVHVVVVSVLTSTSSTTLLAALSSFFTLDTFIKIFNYVYINKTFAL